MSSFQRKGQIVVVFVFFALTLFAARSIYTRPVTQLTDQVEENQPVQTVNQPETRGDQATMRSYPSLWKYAGKLIIILAFMIGLIYAASIFIKRKDSKFTRRFGSVPINILGTSYIGSKQKILLISVFDQYLLLGVTDQTSQSD